MHELMQACVRAIVRVAAQLSERACLADEMSSVSKISARSSAVSEGSLRSSERSSRSWRPTPSGIGTKVSREECSQPPPMVGEASSRYSKRLRSGVEAWKVPGSFPDLICKAQSNLVAIGGKRLLSGERSGSKVRDGPPPLIWRRRISVHGNIRG